jgi:hypothetical protein
MSAINETGISLIPVNQHLKFKNITAIVIAMNFSKYTLNGLELLTFLKNWFKRR